MPHHSQTPVIGILGGVASGKSLVADEFCRLGAQRLDGDRAGHAVLLEPEIEHVVRQRWGDTVFGPDGRIDRRALGRIVFAAENKEQLAYLESLTHPRIGERLRAEAERLAADPDVPALVLDAPVMLKAGWNEFCDMIVFVDVPRPQRVERARRRGWTEEDFAAREAAQESLNVKRAHADVVIDNSDSVESTRAQVERLWHSLIG